MPVSVFRRVPPVEVLSPLEERVVAPAPAMVRARPVPVMPPVSVRVPASDWMRELALSVTAPEIELVPERLRRAPLELEPLPERPRVSAPMAMELERASVAPSETVVPAAVVPRALAWRASRTPAEMAVEPV